MKKSDISFLSLLEAAFLMVLPFTVSGTDALKPVGEAVKLAPLSVYTILTPEKATDQELTAAGMLSDYLERATGVRLKVVREPEKPEGNIIHVGETAFAKSLGAAPERQSYCIAVKDGSLVLRGGIYGVLAFLEEDLGIRWYNAKDEPAVPKLDPDTISFVPRSYTPPFEIREPLYDDIIRQPEWCGFNRLQVLSFFVNIPESLGGGFSHSRYFVHTYDRLIPAKKYFETHPEYFPLKNGKRFASSEKDGQLCYTSKGAADEMARQIEEAIKAKPESRVYSISQNDNVNVNCECEECQKVIALDGIPGAMLLLANRVSERLAETMPDIRITTLAYVESQTPTQYIHPASNTVMLYAPIRERGGALQYLPWTDIPQLVDELTEWRRIAKRVYVWDYVNTSTVPFPNLDVIDRNIPYWREAGVTGVFLEGCHFRLNSLEPLKLWVFAKKLWNPDCNLDALIEEFIAGYYGEAAPEMREYTAFQRSKWKAFYDNRKPGDSITFTPEDRKIMQDLLEKAYRKTPSEKIARELCCFYAMTLSACTKNNAAEYEANLNRVLDLLARHKLKMISHPAKADEELLNTWKEQLAEVKSGTAFPVYCEESIVLKKRKLWLKVPEVEAPGSYTGRVPRQFAKTDWGVQWNFSKLLAAAPNQSVYVVRMRVKPDLKEGTYKPEDPAFSLHLWRSGVSEEQGRYVTFSDLKGDDWQYVYFFKVYMFSLAAAGYFYNCIGDLADGDGIFYDLIEFIPVEKFEDKALADSLPQIIL